MKKILSLLLVSAILLSMLSLCVNTFAQSNEIVLNIASKEYTEIGSGWSESTLADFNGGKTHYSGAGGAAAQWQPTLSGGIYTVYIYKIVHLTGDKKAKVDVVHASGVETKTVNYTEGSSGWVELGTFTFKEGSSGFVKLSRVEANIRTGSVKFVKQGSGGVSAPAPAPKAEPVIIEKFTDINESVYKDSIEFLSRLMLIKGKEKGKFMPADSITRAEFAKIVVSALGMSDIKQIDTKFSDVPSSHWASGYVAAAEVLGIINGFEDGTFRPEENVTYNQAVKMIVSALGYQMKAQAGVYPDSWIAVASDLGIMRGTTATGEKPVNRETVARLVDNSLDIDLLVRTGYGNEIKYEAYRGKNLLTERLGVLRVEGQITANYFTSIGGASSLKANEVMIDRDKYYVGSTDASDNLGRYIIAYVTDETKSGDTPTILALRQKPGKNETITIGADKIAKKSTEREFCYEDENDKERTLTISKSADMIYNGKAKVAWSKSDFDLDTGSVTFLDNNNDGEQDIIFVKSFKNLIVKSVSASENTVYFKYETAGFNSLKLDPKDNDVKFTLVKSDKSPIMLKDLKEWDVLSVARSSDKTVVEAIASQNKISGKIAERDDENVIIGDKKYAIAKSYLNNQSLRQPKVDDQADFYLNFEGQIAAINFDAYPNKNYAYLVDFDTSKGVDKRPIFKLFTYNGDMVLLKADDKIMFNDIKRPSADILNSPLIKGEDGKVKRQLVVYDTNSKGLLSELKTATDKTSSPSGVYSSEFAKNAVLTSSVFRGGQLKMFASKYLIREETKLFMIPSGSDADDSLYRIIGVNYFGSDKTYSNLEIYDVTKDYRVSAITMISSNYITNSSPIAVIKKVTKGVNEKGEYINNIYAFADGKEVVLKSREEGLKATFKATVLSDPFTEPSVTGAVDANGTPILTDYINIENLTKGDIIQYTLNQSGELDFVKVLLRGNTPLKSELLGNGAKPSASDAYSDLYYGYGKVKAKIADGIVFTIPATPNDYERVHVLAGAKFYLVDKEAERVTETNQDEIVEDDMVFVRVAGTSTKEVVIYR